MDSASDSAQAAIEAIDAVLPQTQCTRCGYEACRPYAQAIVLKGAAINRCPPGGPDGIRALSAITGQAELPLNPDCGQAGPPLLALINPGQCIGCTLCIAACPVDAIVGGFKKMHRVIREDCTGCELCLPPCPVNCISLVPHPDRAHWTAEAASQARTRYQARQARLHERTLSKEARQTDKRRQLLQAARQKAQAKRATQT